MKKFRLLTLLALLMTVATGAWAHEQSETIATTANVVEGTHFTISNNDAYVNAQGMNADEGITVTAKNGETITKVFIICRVGYSNVHDYNTSISSGTKEVTDAGVINVTGVNASTFTFTCSDTSPMFSQFDVYYTEAPAAPTGYTVSMKEGTEDATNWTITPAEATTTGVAAGTEVKATYNGTKKVKSVKAVKKASDTTLDNTITAWTAGTYAVPAGGLTYSDAITVSGDVTLVLTDGETLTLNKGISLASGATLTVEGNGTMNVNGTNNSTASTVAGTGTLVLTSGTLNAKGGNGQGVGYYATNTDKRANAGGNAINGNVTVSGGTLTAIGGNGGGVGDFSAGSYGAAGGVAISGSVTVTGGAVTATGGNGGSIGGEGRQEYGGAGGAAIGGDATISGGTWTATDGTHGVNGKGQGGAGGKAVAGTVTDNR